ncbi:hypothetical protein OG592_42455 (plasmid) [Streptomyces avidinii]|uniref:hypothetical protein n=1 Tax=Streptomyces avidinii TaxID=1895 RepID=UPI0038637671|nr:hypothetical protein OG592_42455 [Streptomyces avidinii]
MQVEAQLRGARPLTRPVAAAAGHEADVDLTRPLADWDARLSLVRDKAVPLPEPVAALLVELTEQLTATTADAPLAALRAVGVLERIATRVGREAAGVLAEGGVSAEAVAAGLGTTRSKALMLFLTAQGGDSIRMTSGVRGSGARPAGGREVCANSGPTCEEFRRTAVT